MRNRLHQTMRLFLRACSKDLFYSCWFGIGLHYYLYLHTTLRLVRMQWRRKLQGQGPRWVPMGPDAGAMGHGPEMFQTFNQQHNPLQKFGKIAKTYGALRQALRWAPMGPDGPRWAPMGQPLKKTTTFLAYPVGPCKWSVFF